MKRKIRLTESELVNLVKKIIKEQVDGVDPSATKDSPMKASPSSSLGQPLSKPINIKIDLPTKKGTQTYLTIITKYKKTKDGCDFMGYFQGEDSNKLRTFQFKCDGSLFMDSGILSKPNEVEISDQARGMLNRACGCNAFASNQTQQSGGQSQMA